MIDRYSLHKIHHTDQFTFDPSDYSLFKFGDKLIAEIFGKELFKGFLEHNRERLLREDIHIFPSPFMSIPTASNYLAHFFKIELDRFLFENNLPSSKISKISRKQTYTTDYGNLSFEERKRLISNDTYHIDKNLLNNKFCVFVDDIKITGSHEYTIKKILEDFQVEGEYLFVYFAELMNKEIHPKIENYFNYYAVDGIERLVSLMNKDEFVFNTRVIKYVLSQTKEKFDYVLDNINEDLQVKLGQLAISNDYHLIDDYKINIKTLYHGNKLTKRAETEY